MELPYVAGNGRREVAELWREMRGKNMRADVAMVCGGSVETMGSTRYEVRSTKWRSRGGRYGGKRR